MRSQSWKTSWLLGIGFCAATSFFAPSDALARWVSFSDTIELDEGGNLQLNFEKIAGKSYDICVIPTSNSSNPDLYTHYVTWATPDDHQHLSANPAGDDDCVYLRNVKETGPYYYSIYANGEKASFTYYVWEL